MGARDDPCAQNAYIWGHNGDADMIQWAAPNGGFARLPPAAVTAGGTLPRVIGGTVFYRSAPASSALRSCAGAPTSGTPDRCYFHDLRSDNPGSRPSRRAVGAEDQPRQRFALACPLSMRIRE